MPSGKAEKLISIAPASPLRAIWAMKSAGTSSPSVSTVTSVMCARPLLHVLGSDPALGPSNIEASPIYPSSMASSVWIVSTDCLVRQFRPIVLAAHIELCHHVYANNLYGEYQSR